MLGGFVAMRRQSRGKAIAMIELAFETDILSIMTQAMLAAFACALIVAVWTDQQE
jgi:hypothetical protein